MSPIGRSPRSVAVEFHAGSRTGRTRDDDENEDKIEVEVEVEDEGYVIGL